MPLAFAGSSTRGMSLRVSYVPQRSMHQVHTARLCSHNATPTLPSQILNRRGLAFARASLRSHPPHHTRVSFESTITLCILRGLEGEDSAGSGDRKWRSHLDEEGQKRLSRKWMDGPIGKWGDLKMSASMFASICSFFFFFFFRVAPNMRISCWNVRTYG